MYGDQRKFQEDPHWRDLILFYEYFHGDNGRGVGASHQTGWTGVVADLLHRTAPKPAAAEPAQAPATTTKKRVGKPIAPPVAKA